MQIDKVGALYLITSYSGQTFIGKLSENTEVDQKTGRYVELEDTLELVDQAIMTQHGMVKAKNIATIIPGYDKLITITTSVSSFIEVPSGSNMEEMYNKTKAELCGIHLASVTDLNTIKNSGMIKI